MGEQSGKQGISDVAGETVKAPTWDLKIAVLVPSTGTWNANTAECITNMVATFSDAYYDGGTKEIKVFGVQCSIIPDSRHRLVAMAHRWGATHALFIDSDMIVPFDTVNQILKWNQPIVAANCVRRKLPTYPTAFTKEKRYIYSTPDKHGLEEVDQVGCAVMMIDMRVFATPGFELPWFAFEPDPDHLPGCIGEDIYFCRKIKALGCPIHIDHDLSRMVKHMGDMAYSMDMAQMSESFYTKMEKDHELHVQVEDPKDDGSSLIFFEAHHKGRAEFLMRTADWKGVCVKNGSDAELPEGWEEAERFEDILKLYPSQKNYLFLSENFTPGLDWAKRLVRYCGPWDVVYGPDGKHNDKLPAHPCIGHQLMHSVGPLFTRGNWFFANAMQDIAEELGTLKYSLDAWGDLKEEKEDWERIASKTGQIEKYMQWKEDEFPHMIGGIKTLMNEYYSPETLAN